MKTNSKSGIVVVIGTGGTIAGIARDAAHPYAYDDCLVDIATPLQGLPLPHGVEVEPLQLMQVGSEDFDSVIWQRIRHAVLFHSRRPEVRGIVVAQGTDTLEETAFFLWLSMSPSKPIVLTGSMRPIGSVSSDAAINLFHSIAVAGHPSSKGKGLLVVANERVFCPFSVSKRHTLAADSFAAGEEGPLALMLGTGPHWLRAGKEPPAGWTPPDLSGVPLPKVGLVCAYAGIGPDTVDCSLVAGAQGLVYAGTGNGTVASTVKPALQRAAQSGCLVIRASRVPDGVVVENAAEDDGALGTVASGRLTAVKARVALQLALAAGLNRNELAFLIRSMS